VVTGTVLRLTRGTSDASLMFALLRDETLPETELSLSAPTSGEVVLLDALLGMEGESGDCSLAFTDDEVGRLRLCTPVPTRLGGSSEKISRESPLEVDWLDC
jgi:hypothetical protein